MHSIDCPATTIGTAGSTAACDAVAGHESINNVRSITNGGGGCTATLACTVSVSDIHLSTNTARGNASIHRYSLRQPVVCSGGVVEAARRMLQIRVDAALRLQLFAGCARRCGCARRGTRSWHGDIKLAAAFTVADLRTNGPSWYGRGQDERRPRTWRRRRGC